MGKVAINVNPDGTVRIMVPVANKSIDDLARKAFGGAGYTVVEDTAVPSDREFRNAWKLNNTVVDVDMPKARNIHMNKIRRFRDAELAKSDIDLNKAQDNNDIPEQNRLRAKRQQLRDIPQTFDLSGATTPEELKALWPSGLPKD